LNSGKQKYETVNWHIKLSGLLRHTVWVGMDQGHQLIFMVFRLQTSVARERHRDCWLLGKPVHTSWHVTKPMYSGWRLQIKLCMSQ